MPQPPSQRLPYHGMSASRPGTRRSSAAGITSAHRPPLPPQISNRSQSLDGLLDSNADEHNAGDIKQTVNEVEGVSVRTRKHDQGDSTKNSNRKSKSMEDLLDERDEHRLSSYQAEDCTKSLEDIMDEQKSQEESMEKEYQKFMENNVNAMKKSNDVESQESLVRAPTPIEQPRENETITVENSLRSDTSSLNDDSSSVYSRQDSTTSSKDSEKKNKTFLNKYVKKVKSLMKK